MIDANLIRSLALAGDDFGFEIRTGKILRSAKNAKIDHGGTYKPLGQNQLHRQYDYRFSIRKEHENGDMILQLAVECKNLFNGSPAVICGGPRVASESRHEILTSDLAIIMTKYDTTQGMISFTLSDTPSRLYPIGGFVGKSVIRPEPASKEKELVSGSKYKLTGDSEIYDRWNQSVLHTCSLLSPATKFWHKSHRPCFTATLPIVVVPNSTLWTITYDENGSIMKDPEMVNASTVYCGREVQLGSDYSDYNQRANVSHIHFLTLAGLQEFVSSIMEETSELWGFIFPADTMSNHIKDRSNPVRLS